MIPILTFAPVQEVDDEKPGKPRVGCEVVLTAYYEAASPPALPDSVAAGPAATAWSQQLAAHWPHQKVFTEPERGYTGREYKPAPEDGPTGIGGIAELNLLNFRPRYGDVADVEVVQLLANVPALPSEGGWTGASDYLLRELMKLYAPDKPLLLGYTLVFRGNLFVPAELSAAHRSAAAEKTAVRELRGVAIRPSELPSAGPVAAEALSPRPAHRRETLADSAGWLGLYDFPTRHIALDRPLVYVVLGFTGPNVPPLSPQFDGEVYAEREAELVKADLYLHKTFHFGQVRAVIPDQGRSAIRHATPVAKDEQTEEWAAEQFRAAIDGLLKAMAAGGDVQEAHLEAVRRNMAGYTSISWGLSRTANSISQQIAGLGDLYQNGVPPLAIIQQYQQTIKAHQEATEAEQRKYALTLETAQTAFKLYEANESKKTTETLRYLTLIQAFTGLFFALTGLFDRDFALNLFRILFDSAKDAATLQGARSMGWQLFFRMLAAVPLAAGLVSYIISRMYPTEKLLKWKRRYRLVWIPLLVGWLLWLLSILWAAFETISPRPQHEGRAQPGASQKESKVKPRSAAGPAAPAGNHAVPNNALPRPAAVAR